MKKAEQIIDKEGCKCICKFPKTWGEALEFRIYSNILQGGRKALKVLDKNGGFWKHPDVTGRCGIEIVYPEQQEDNPNGQQVANLN